MKIAVTYEDGQVFQHFGQSKQFLICDTEEGKITASRVQDTGGNGHGALAGFLKEHAVSALICGGIGGGAKQALAEQGIQLYAGVSGNAQAAAEALLAGTLQHNPDTQCNHHGHEHHHGEGHSCI